ncbi:MAG: hypothetical protein PVH69_06905 [Desulfobacterales bacterium]|jgi:hypothetical protein
MDFQGIRIIEMPVLKKPVLVAGFGGWGNALIEIKPELREMINKLRKEKFRGTASEKKTTGKKEEKVITIKDFFDS